MLENIVFQKCFYFLGECCTRVEVYYKNKTKAYETNTAIYGSYTRVIGDDVSDHYHYRSNFANGFFGIWFCGNNWIIGKHSDKGKCTGSAHSNINTDKCVHDITVDWKYANVTIWSDAGEGLAVKCLYEHGNC